jgi:hypothetical protein
MGSEDDVLRKVGSMLDRALNEDTAQHTRTLEEDRAGSPVPERFRRRTENVNLLEIDPSKLSPAQIDVIVDAINPTLRRRRSGRDCRNPPATGERDRNHGSSSSNPDGPSKRALRFGRCR